MSAEDRKVHIFTPFRLKGLTIPNRIVLPPMVRFSVVGRDGFVNDRLVDWYRSAARAGVGLIIVEATAVSADGKLRENQIGIWDNAFIPGLRKITGAVHRYDTKILIQLHHRGFREEIAAVPGDLLERIREDFKAAVGRAKAAGFDGVELHGAHAYLLSQLASPLWNKRVDRYGGDLPGRMRFAADLIAETKAFFDEKFILGYRMGGNEPDLPSGVALARYLEGLGVDLLHVSTGVPDPAFRRERKIDGVPADFPLDWVVWMGTEIKRRVSLPVVVVHRIREERQASWLIEQGLADFAAVGRAMLGNPGWMDRARKSWKARKMAKACERESRERESCKGQKHGGYASDLDIFCEVIDNYGDIGVVLRLAKEFRRRGGPDIRIRVVVNDLNALAAIHPGIRDVEAQELGGIAFFRDREFREAGRGIARTAIGAFGCDPPEAYLAEGREKGMLLLDLQYLTGEKWAEDFHLKPSMVPGKLRKFFYFPGFTPESGGLLQRPQFRERVRLAPEKFVNKYFGEFSGPQKRLKIVVFSYERDFSGLLEALRKLDKPAALLVCGGKSRAAFGKFIGEFQKKDFGNIHICGKIEMKYAEFFTQDQFEELLNAADVNFVRGEDSAAQAATAGKPFLWELYPQRDNVQLDKLEGFLRTYGKFFPGGAESQAARETSELFRAYNSGDGALRDAPAERYLAFFKNLRTIGEACGAFSAELARSCDLLTKIKTIIQEYAGGKL